MLINQVKHKNDLYLLINNQLMSIAHTMAMAHIVTPHDNIILDPSPQLPPSRQFDEHLLKMHLGP
jgi:hypothetical protein